MKITILTVDSRSDVQPFVALGKGLQAAGHEITLATHEEWAAPVRAEGLGYVHPLMKQRLREQLDTAMSACCGADALVFTLLAVAGYHLAEKLRLPCCAASLQPVSVTRCFPSPLLPAMFSFGPTNLVRGGSPSPTRRCRK